MQQPFFSWRGEGGVAMATKWRKAQEEDGALKTRILTIVKK